MKTYTVTAPDTVSIEVINGALAALGAQASPKVTRQRASSKPAAIDAEFPDVVVRHKETGEVIREIDGISAQKAIAKLMADIRRNANSDGRGKHVFPSTASGEAYIRQFCANLNHVPAAYACGVTA